MMARTTSRAGSGTISSGTARVLWHGLLLGCCTLAGCTEERILGDYPPSTCDLAEASPDERGTTLNISSFWTADEHEREALLTLVNRVDATRYMVSLLQEPTRAAAQLQLKDAFDKQQLPDLIQVNGGSDVFRWVDAFSGRGNDMCPLDPLRSHLVQESAYFPATLAPLTCRGNLYALPVGVHRLNVLFFNQEVFQRVVAAASARGITLPSPDSLESARDLVSLLQSVADLQMTNAEGDALVPIAVGNNGGPWPLTILAFENVLLSLGRSNYEQLWKGGLERDDAKAEAALRSTLHQMLELLRELNAVSNTATLTWQECLSQVGQGKALMTVMGDWGWAQLEEGELANVATVQFPGTSQTFVYTPDSFAVPRELGKNGSTALAFLSNAVTDATALIDFANAKHAIPPLRHIDASRLNSESQRSTYAEFEQCGEARSDCQLLLAVSGLAPAPGSNPCFDRMDALLAMAVSGVTPENPDREHDAACQRFPRTREEAERRLLDLLIDVAHQPFAAACR